MIVTVIGLFGIVCLLAAWTDPRRRQVLEDQETLFRPPPRPRKRFYAPADPEWPGSE